MEPALLVDTPDRADLEGQAVMELEALARKHGAAALRSIYGAFGASTLEAVPTDRLEEFAQAVKERAQQ